MNDLKTQIEKTIKKYKTIGFFDTPENRSVWETFTKFSELESDGNYLLGIKMLLQSYSTDWKYSALYDEIQELKIKINNTQSQPVMVEETKKIKTFGKKDMEEIK